MLPSMVWNMWSQFCPEIHIFSHTLQKHLFVAAAGNKGTKITAEGHHVPMSMQPIRILLDQLEIIMP